MFESRAQLILPKGITPKRLKAQSLRSIAAIKQRIEQLAAPYMEVDNSIDGAMHELMAAFDEFENRINETQRFLEEGLE